MMGKKFFQRTLCSSATTSSSHHLLSIVWRLPGILLASHFRVLGSTHPAKRLVQRIHIRLIVLVVGSILPEHCITCRLWLWDDKCSTEKKSCHLWHMVNVSKSPRLETDEIFERLLFTGILQTWPWSRTSKIIFWNPSWRIIQECEMENSHIYTYI